MRNVESKEGPNFLKRTASALLVGIGTIVHPAAALPSSAHQEEDTPTIEVAEEDFRELNQEEIADEEMMAEEEVDTSKKGSDSFEVDVTEEAPVIIIPKSTPTIGPEKPPVILERFGNIETERVEFVNKGKSAFVVQGDPKLYQNMLWIRDNYARFPDIKRRIYFYDDIEQLRKESGVPYNFPVNTEVSPASRLWKYGERRWQKLPNGILEFHIVIPTSPDKNQGIGELAGAAITDDVERSLWSDETGIFDNADRYGKAGSPAGSQKRKDLEEHPIFTRDKNTRAITKSPFFVVRKGI